MDVLLNRNKSKFTVKKLLIILFWLILWEVADRVVNNRIILCGPISIISSLINQITKSDFLSICGASFVRISVGFLLSFALGFLLAIAAYKFKLLRACYDNAKNSAYGFVCNNAFDMGWQSSTYNLFIVFNRIADDIHEYACGT